MKKIAIGLFLCATTLTVHSGDVLNWFEAQTAKSAPDTVVIAPGFKVLVDGRPVDVIGNQRCPDDSQRAGKLECVVVTKATKAVVVTFVLDGKPVTEEWQVERLSPTREVLRRPNGEYIAAAH